MKMKFAALATVLTAAAFMAPTVSANDQVAQSICSYIAADSKNNLRKTLSDNRLRLRAIYDNVQCDGLNLVRFAIKNNAADTASFILSQLPGSFVASSGDADWAASNGFSASPIIDAIKERSAS